MHKQQRAKAGMGFARGRELGLLEIVLAKGAKGARGSKDCLSGALRRRGGSDPGAWSGRCDGEAEVTRVPGRREATVRRESFRGAELGEAIFCPFRRLRPFCQSRHMSLGAAFRPGLRPDGWNANIGKDLFSNVSNFRVSGI